MWFLEELPEAVDINGTEFEVRSGFRAFFLIDRVLKDPELLPDDKMNEALSIFYKDEIPPDREKAISSLQWFQRGGKNQKEAEGHSTAAEKSGIRKNRPEAIDFEKDAGYLYASFLQAYGIDLTNRNAGDLHWWKFLSLLESLPEECLLSKIMYYRTASLSGLGKEQKKFVKKMKDRYSLAADRKTDGNRAREEKERKRLERDRQMLAYVELRYKETGGQRRQ